MVGINCVTKGKFALFSPVLFFVSAETLLVNFIITGDQFVFIRLC